MLLSLLTVFWCATSGISTICMSNYVDELKPRFLNVVAAVKGTSVLALVVALIVICWHEAHFPNDSKLDAETTSFGVAICASMLAEWLCMLACLEHRIFAVSAVFVSFIGFGLRIAVLTQIAEAWLIPDLMASFGGFCTAILWITCRSGDNLRANVVSAIHIPAPVVLIQINQVNKNN